MRGKNSANGALRRHRLVRVTCLMSILVILLAGTGVARAAIQGDYDYEIDGGTIRLIVDKICHSLLGDGSGDLKLKMYATDTPYTTGSSISGYAIGEATFMGGIGCISDIDVTVTYASPPAGVYYLTLLLLEDVYDTNEFYIIDHRSFAEMLEVGGSGGPPVDDHGDSCYEASVVGLNTTTAAVLDAADDRDVFQLVLPAPGTLTLYTSGMTDTKGILGEPCKPIAVDTDSGSGANFRISEALAPGTYTIGVLSEAGIGGAYTLHVEWTAGASGADFRDYCTPLSGIADLPVRAAEISGFWLSFLLTYFPNPLDPSNLYWMLDLDTAALIQGGYPLLYTGELIHFAPDLDFDMCIQLGGETYTFSMEFYANPSDPNNFYWRLNIPSIRPFDPPN